MYIMSIIKLFYFIDKYDSWDMFTSRKTMAMFNERIKYL